MRCSPHQPLGKIREKCERIMVSATETTFAVKAAGRRAAASIAGGMAAAHYDKFSGLVATRINDIAETAVKIARAIDAEARKQP